jgi:hypothetical protein
MGEILNYLNDYKSRLEQKKSYLQEATTTITNINKELTKVTFLINKIIDSGWDA